MALDPSIILRGQAPKLDSPFDVMSKAMTLKQLANQNRALEEERANAQAYKDVFKRNVVTGDDGSTSLNKKAVLSDLYKLDPAKAMEFEQKSDQMDFEAQNRRFETLQKQTQIAKDIIWSINDPVSYEQARQMGIKFGLPNADKMPTQYPGDEFVSNLKARVLTASEQLAEQQREFERNRQLSEAARDQRNKDRNYGIQREELGIRRAEAQNKGIENSTKMTEAQSKALGFGRRAMLADQMINQISSDPNADVTSLKTQVRMQLPKWMGGIKDDREQSLATAKLAFVASVLRKESGAAVTPEEFSQYDKIYFPQPGDSKQTLADKRVLRQNFIDTERLSAGNAWRDPIPLPGRGSSASGGWGIDEANAGQTRVFKTNEIDWAD